MSVFVTKGKGKIKDHYLEVFPGTMESDLEEIGGCLYISERMFIFVEKVFEEETSAYFTRFGRNEISASEWKRIAKKLKELEIMSTEVDYSEKIKIYNEIDGFGSNDEFRETFRRFIGDLVDGIDSVFGDMDCIIVVGI